VDISPDGSVNFILKCSKGIVGGKNYGVNLLTVKVRKDHNDINRVKAFKPGDFVILEASVRQHYDPTLKSNTFQLSLIRITSVFTGLNSSTQVSGDFRAMNSVVLIGYVGMDPSISKASNDKEMAFFSVASDLSTKSDEPDTVFYSISATHNVDFIRNYIVKGCLVMIEGALNTYESNGVPQANIQMYNITKLKKAKSEETQGTQEKNATAAPEPKSVTIPSSDNADEVPF
jgi:single-stranded DNA-binding protein